MKISSQFLLLFVMCALLSGCNSPANTDTEFWSHNYMMQPDVEYGDHPSQKLDLYLHGSYTGEPTWFETSTDARPTLLFIHGGGWVQGTKTGKDVFLLPFLERGWNVVNMTYRLGPDTAPQAVDDAVCALAWVASAAHLYGFDRDQIVVSGASAGGHLSLTTGILGSRPGHRCYVEDDFEVAAVINWFGITDIEDVDRFLDETIPEFNYARAWIGEESEVTAISDMYSPIRIVDSESPPVFTAHGEEDAIVPHYQAVRYHEKLSELGIRNELQSLPGGKHMGFTADQFQTIWQAMFRFLDELGVGRS